MRGFGGRRINAEKAVFLLAALWLVAMGLRYLDAPEIDDPGPAMTFARPGEVIPVNLDIAPLEEFLCAEARPGGAGTGREIIGGGGGDESAEGPGGTVIHEDDDEETEDDGDDKDDKDGGPVVAVAAGPEYRWVGTVKVGEGDRWTVLKEKATGEYLAGAGMKVVRQTGDRVVIEDEAGERFTVPVPRRGRGATNAAAD